MLVPSAPYSILSAALARPPPDERSIDLDTMIRATIAMSAGSTAHAAHQPTEPTPRASRWHTPSCTPAVLQSATDVPERLNELISRSADGNSYFVEELVSMLIDEGVVVTDGDGDGWRIDLDRFDV